MTTKGDPNGAVDDQTHQEKAIDQAQKRTAAKTAADILSRPRLPPKKKLSASNSTGKKLGKKNQQRQQGTITRVDEEEAGGAEGQAIDNEQLLEQLLNQTTLSPPPSPLKTQTDQPSSNGGNPTRSNTISRKLHDLGEDIKEVAHAKPNRTKLKIAKRNAAQLQAQLDAQLESQLSPKIDPRKLENEDLLRTCSALKLQIFEIVPDGHCLFSAIADQMNILEGRGKIEERYTYDQCRKIAAEYMRGHVDEFIHYLPGQDEGLSAGLMSLKEYQEHCDRILALSKALKVAIHVVQAFHPPIKVSDEFLELRDNKALTISYHRKSYGLGEHYNSSTLLLLVV
ncbi:hypothetical protein PtA15_10A463 [Puccinia triticina]|uniref:OTU domain-containing protein n=1 Tax=Puccinia triticina TaxID=208348 RepID=A0ABY7CWL2_9BASI|nr:uncharacterized protein PtA15_10A463 [Puccinia triticina]WAQ89040.1 hypothetical protein PtA15_10A463 [Puccinia triticina]